MTYKIQIQRNPEKPLDQISRTELFTQTEQHQADVGAVIEKIFIRQLEERAQAHDCDKILNFNRFHANLSSNFQETDWWDNHKKTQRHHLDPRRVGGTVNLIDIIEHITDCVCAGLARKGKDGLYPPKIDPEMLAQAVDNTVKLIIENIELIPQENHNDLV